MAIQAETVLALGVFVGIISGVFGVGGGFLITPFLIFMGVPPPVAVGTQANQIIASSLTGVLSHWKNGNVDFKIGTVMLIGGLGGSIIGILLFRLLEYLGQIDLTISILYILLLGSIGTLMMIESIKSIFFSSRTEQKKSKYLYQHPFFRSLPWKMRFPRSRLYVSVIIPGGIGFIGGLLVSVMGIGGGFLLVPAMIYFLGMPILMVAGTSLYQIIFTSAFATIMHATFNHTVDLLLALLLIAGGVVGVQIGILLARKLKGTQARIILAVIILCVALKLVGDLLIEPVEHYTTGIR
jgi:uncharacterized protein